MKSYLLFSVLLALTGWTYAQGPGSIENIDVSQRTDEEERVVDIQFDLDGSGDYYDVYLEVSFDNGLSFTRVNPREVTGANDLAPDNNIGIVWDGRMSYPELSAEEARVRLTATSKVKDIDGNYYRTVKIGDQLWMAENLRVTRDAEGNDIIRLCYGNNTTNCNLYGGLYSWNTVMNGESSSSNPSGVQGICPDGWHMPSDAEWTQLIDYVSDQGFPNFSVVNGAGNALKSCRQVDSPLGGDCNTSEHPRWDSDAHSGFDEFGFSALPGGYCFHGSFRFIGEVGIWWSATEDSHTSAWYRGMGSYSGDVDRGDTNKSGEFSVRCVRNVDN